MARFFIDRPIFAWVIAIIIMLAGGLSITRLPIARWEFDTDRWEKHLSQAGFWLASAQEFHDPRMGHWPTTLLIRARKL